MNFFDNMTGRSRKNKIIKILTLPLKFVPACLYFLISILFFSAYGIFSAILHPNKKPLSVTPAETEIDGVSFIIPTWNKKDMVIDCVRHLDNVLSSEVNDVAKEIIVVDNGSVDGTYEALTNLHTRTKLTIIKSETNLGFAKGINLGAKNAKYNYLYLINNDMIANPGVLTALISFARGLNKENKHFFGLSSQIFFYDRQKRREESGKTYYKPDFGFLQVAHSVNGINLESPSITGFPGGGSSLINKALFLKLGGYDGDVYMPLYDEDLDLGFIAWKLGYPSYFVPASTIVHHHRTSSKTLKADPDFYLHKNWLTFILKNYDSISMTVHHCFFYSLRMLGDTKFLAYAWHNVKIMNRIFNKKIFLSKFRNKYTDYELINFPRFELYINGHEN